MNYYCTIQFFLVESIAAGWSTIARWLHNTQWGTVPSRVSQCAGINALGLGGQSEQEASLYYPVLHNSLSCLVLHNSLSCLVLHTPLHASLSLACCCTSHWPLIFRFTLFCPMLHYCSPFCPMLYFCTQCCPMLCYCTQCCPMLYCCYFRIINRPGVAGAVLQTALLLVN